MKIRHPLLIKAAGFAGAWLLRGWIRTLRFRYCPLGPNFDPRRRQLRDRYLYAFWHENLLLPAFQYGRLKVHVLISQHADGRLIAEIIRHLGFRAVHGSTTRGAVEAVRGLLALGSSSHLAITPDGPRGPRRQVQPGLVFLSSRLGMPIVPVGIGYDRPWRLRSWDRFAVPRPGTRATCVTAEPILVPPNAARGLLEEYRQRVEAQLLALTEAAERWAEDGIAPALRASTRRVAPRLAG